MNFAKNLGLNKRHTYIKTIIMITLFILFTWLHFYRITKFEPTDKNLKHKKKLKIFYLYNTPISFEFLKIEPDARKYVNKLPRNKFFHTQYKVYMHLSIFFKKNIVISGEILPELQQQKYKHIITKNVNKKNIFFVECFKVLAIFIMLGELKEENFKKTIDIEKQHDLILEQYKKRNIYINKKDIVLLEFEEKEINRVFDIKIEEYMNREEEVLQMLDPLIEPEIKQGRNLNYLLCFVKE